MKNCIKTLSVVVISLVAVSTLNAKVFTEKYSTTRIGESEEDYKLITDMLIGPGVARHPTGALIPQTKSCQVGVFSNLVAEVIPSFTNGVILSTGEIEQGISLSNGYAKAYWEGEAVWPGWYPPEYGNDPDLYNKFGYDLADQAGIVLYIQPRNKTINIPFVMASEEFYCGYDSPEYPDQQEYEDYSDKFVFFLKAIADASDPNAFDANGNVKDDGSSMEWNIAQLPGGGDVEIASVNQHTNTQYFISNVVTNEDGKLDYPMGDINLPMEFNGAIVGPVAVAEGLDTNKIYKLKIIIADEYNNNVNSVVFLRERGITSGADLKIDVTGPTSAEPNGEVTYTDTVSNIGPATADGVVVTNYLPVGAVLKSKTFNSGSVEPITIEGSDCLITNGLIWTIGDRFASGSNAVMTVTCTLPDAGGVYTNLASVVTDTGDYDESNNTDKCVTLVGNVKPLLTIKAIETNKVYGAEMVLDATQFVASITDDTNGTYTATGIDVTFTNDVGQVAYPTNAAADVGMYGIYLSNIKGLDLEKFRGVEWAPGSIEIKNPIQMQVRVDNLSKVYDGNPLEATYSYTTNALVAGDVLEVVLSGTPRTNAGSNDVIVTSCTVSRAGVDVTSEYTFEIIPGSLNVEKRPLVINIRPGSTTPKTYGTEYHFWDMPGNYTTEGLVQGEDVTLELESLGAAADAKCGTYDITAKNLAGVGATDLNNYAITINPGKMAVGRLPITITANDVTNCYGEAVVFAGTEFTLDKELPNGEQVTEVNLKWLGPDKPDADTYQDQIEPDYEVKGSNGFDTNNYTIGFVNGALTVTQAVLTITANSKTRPYGTTIPILKTDFTILPTELPNDETLTNVTIVCPEAGIPLAPLGTYPIVPSHDVTGSLDTNNYNIVFVNGLLTVTPTEFTASAEPVAKYYDGTPTNIIVKLQGLPEPVTPKFEYSYSENDGYVPESSFTGPTNVEESAEVWCRAIAPGTTNTVHAKVTILPRVVVEQADGATRAYNGEPLTNAVHFFEGSAASNLAKSVYFDLAQHDVYDGPARDDWADAVGFVGANGFARAPMTAASTITDPGTQPNVIDQDAVTFTASTKTNNYVINYLDGQLTVTLSTALTLEVFDVEKFYDAEPTNVAYVAKVGGTPIADATVRLHEQGTANWVLATEFESYLDTTNVIVDVAVAKHGYVAVTNSATLLIKPRPVTLVAATDSKTYDGNPLTNWTFEVKADTTTPGYGFVTEAGEGVERVEMAAASTITEPGTVGNVIAAKFAKAGTKLDRNYVVSTENGTLTVDPLGVLTVETSAAEKFYDAVPTNIAYVVKVDGAPTDDATVSLREKGTEAWIAADDFPAYLNATNATVQVMATKPGYLAATDEAMVWVKPRIVVHHAESGKWEYDGTVHTQGEYFEDTDEEAKLSKAKWGTDEILPNSTGFVSGEGYAARLVMTGDSSIKDPGKKPNVIDQSAEKAALKAGTNPVNYEFHYLDGELEVTSTAVLQAKVSANLNWNTGLLDLTLTIKNVGEGAVYSASDYWVELIPGPAETGAVTSVARTYYLNAPTGTLSNGADYVNLTAAVKAALVSAGGDEIFGPGEEITLTGVSVYHWKRWSPDKFIDADAFFVAGPLSERIGAMSQLMAVKPQQIAVATAVDTGVRSSLTSDGTVQAETSLATVYDGVLYDGDALAGTIRVQLAKANKKTGLSKLTATLAPVGGKKVTLSGNFDPNAASFVVTAKDGRALELSVGKDGLSGTFDGLEIDGARNRYSSKDADDKAVVAAADGWMGSYSMVSPGGNGWETYAVKVAKKGKVTIAGTLADGTTVSASAQMIIGAMGCCVPVVIAKKSVSRAFCIWFGEDGIGVDGLEDAIIGNGGNLTAVGTLTFDVGMLLSLLESDTVTVLSDYLPDGAEILPNGKKWVVMPDATGKALKTGSLVWDRKNGVINVEKSKIDGYNVSGLKLTYTATTGVFKGSFKVFEIVKGLLKTVTANLSGIVVDGVGYGTAKVGKFGTVAVMIE